MSSARRSRQNYLEPASQLLEVWRKAAERSGQLGADIVTAVDATLATDESAEQRTTQAGELSIRTHPENG